MENIYNVYTQGKLETFGYFPDILVVTKMETTRKDYQAPSTMGCHCESSQPPLSFDMKAERCEMTEIGTQKLLLFKRISSSVEGHFPARMLRGPFKFTLKKMICVIIYMHV